MQFLTPIRGFSTLAQADAEIQNITAGGAFAAILVLTALAASITMTVLWSVRFREGQPLLPVANRLPLSVPLPLTITAVVLTGMMALLVLLGGIQVSTPVAEDVSEERAVPEGDPTDVADASDDAAAPIPAEEREDSQSDEDQRAAGVAQFEAMLWQTVQINTMMFVIFGFVIFASQRSRSIASTPVDETDVTNAANEPWKSHAANETDAQRLSGDEREWVVELSDQAMFADPSSDGDGDCAEPERWRLNAELRFALEAFLVAYLPTAVLRIAIVSLLPDAPSHPFLEMLHDGVEWQMVALIAAMAIVVAPLVEELMYRVTILGGLWQHGSLKIGLLISSALFAGAHGFPDSLALLPLAFVIGYLYVQRRSYRTVILVHFLFNTFNMAVAGVAML